MTAGAQCGSPNLAPNHPRWVTLHENAPFGRERLVCGYWARCPPVSSSEIIRVDAVEHPAAEKEPTSYLTNDPRDLLDANEPVFRALKKWVFRDPVFLWLLMTGAQQMQELTSNEILQVHGGVRAEGVSKETWGCAIGGAMVGSFGGAWGGAAGCIAGAYVANNWNGWVGDAFGSLNNAAFAL